jgi:phenylalanine-4-hydroxylase
MAIMEKNEVLDKLPKHLMSLVIDQPYNDYTDQDHAVWRYVMKQNVRYLPKVAHHTYLEGLKRTGISIDRIPHMYGMNRILKEIGWAAVAVDGFIPPSAFMEFQAYNVLVIAADIRPINQIEYTPAPDIIHEAAGHAPIIADPEYADYLRLFGEIGSKAISSKKDYQIYNAIRHLSILKADPYTPKSEIEKAERELAELEGIHGELSEMALIRNLHWWTVEYGLVGELDNPKIYGAGLLSSIGESYSSLQPAVKKIPYTIEAANYAFDITTRQPHLFVTPDFLHLNQVLDNFACRMAFRKGGSYGLNKAIESGNTVTCEYNSGLQVSGTVSNFYQKNNKPAYIRTSGPTTLNHRGRLLPGHGKDYHSEGFGSPVGWLKNMPKPLELMTEGDWMEIGVVKGHTSKLEFESGVIVEGTLNKILSREGKNLVLTFDNCTVRYENQVLFEPSWGNYDMAVGSEIYSVFSGPVDPEAFGLTFEIPAEKTHKISHSGESRILHSLYSKVRECREKGTPFDLKTIFNKVKLNFPDEWLLPLEILEIAVDENGFAEDVESYLLKFRNEKPGYQMLIDNGLDMVKELHEADFKEKP